MDCPKCETASLEKCNIKGVEVDRCRKCQGIWFDDKELAALLDLTRKELRSVGSGKDSESLNLKRGRCPRDGSDLLRVFSPKNRTVVLDTCAKCGGIWLDGGELLKLSD
jgi:Zn-finger nucleic acid-binding protein